MTVAVVRFYFDQREAGGLIKMSRHPQDVISRQNNFSIAFLSRNRRHSAIRRWHYIDANLWTSLVSYILEQLAAYVAPEKSEDEQQAALLAQLSTAKTIVAEAEAEKAGAQAVINDRPAVLQELQLKRQEAEVKLADLRFSDLATLLSENEPLKTDLQNSLNEVGAPAVLKRLSDLSVIVSEAHSLRGRVVALFLAVPKERTKLY